MEEILRALTTRGDSRLQDLIKWRKKHAKLVWSGGLGVLFVGVALTLVFFTGTSGSSPLKSASVPDQSQFAAPAAELRPVAAAASSNGDAAAGWIPMYPGSAPQITSSVQTPDGDQNVSTFKTSDAPPRVISYFQDQLKSSGFSIKAASSGEESGILQAEDGLKKRSLILNVSTSPDDKSASVRLVTVERK